MKDLNGDPGNTGRMNSGIKNSGIRNRGHYNAGSSNIGGFNSGDSNSGYFNSGHFNTGYFNSGCWNSSDRETGFFNSEKNDTIRVFNKSCSMDEWQRHKKPFFLYFDLHDDLGYKGSFKKSFESATEEDIKLLKALPNFDADVFFEISGIRIK